MTELAYLADGPAGYVRSFPAQVVSLPPGAVVLDRTFFYPGGGGQPPDRGRLRGPDGEWEIVDVGRTGPTVLHRLRRRAATAGAPPIGPVEGVLDWARRYRHMRLHTGQHLLSARVFTRTSLRTVHASLSGSSAWLDLEGSLPPAALPALESDLLDAVEHPRPVTIRFVPRSEWDASTFAPRSGLVPLPAQVDPVRVIEIEGEDRCPCGGTHLRSTGEVGTVRLTGPVPTDRGGSRLSFTLENADLPTPSE